MRVGAPVGSLPNGAQLSLPAEQVPDEDTDDTDDTDEDLPVHTIADS